MKKLQTHLQIFTFIHNVILKLFLSYRNMEIGLDSFYDMHLHMVCLQVHELTKYPHELELTQPKLQS